MSSSICARSNRWPRSLSNRQPSHNAPLSTAQRRVRSYRRRRVQSVRLTNQSNSYTSPNVTETNWSRFHISKFLGGVLQYKSVQSRGKSAAAW